MKFMSNVLPSAVEGWNISNGSMSLAQVLLHAGGEISCSLTIADLAYIPEAFQLIVKHNASLSWKNPRLFATIDIVYEDGDTLQAIIPFITTTIEDTRYVTISTALVTSKTYESFTFTIHNTLDTDLILSAYELRPSVGLDDSLYNSVESMLPQLVYAYNTSEVVTYVGVGTQILQLPIAISKDTNLLMHMTATGQVAADTITCNAKMDGETIKGFPVKQTVPAGDFFLGIPSLIAFVKKGTHIVTVTLSASNGTLTVPKENALIVLEGKGVLGGASGEYPHAEAVQEIPMVDMPHDFEQSVLISSVVPLLSTPTTNIPMSMNNLATSITMEIIRRGEVISLFSSDGTPPPLTPYDEEMYYTDRYGLKSITAATYTYTKDVRTDCTVTTTVVDTTKFNPVYTKVLSEGVYD